MGLCWDLRTDRAAGKRALIHAGHAQELIAVDAVYRSQVGEDGARKLPGVDPCIVGFFQVVQVACDQQNLCELGFYK